MDAQLEKTILRTDTLPANRGNAMERAPKPPASSPTVSRQMRKMPRRDSKPEIALRQQLHRIGLRFRIQVRGLPGTPDIALTRAKIAIFCDGCFWHACPEHGVLPKANREWWKAKLEANVKRDRNKDSKLRQLGWIPVHVWEHEHVEVATDRIKKLWRERRRSAEPAATEEREE